MSIGRNGFVAAVGCLCVGILLSWVMLAGAVGPDRAGVAHDAEIPAVPEGSHRLLLGPIPGLTTAWHVAPGSCVIPAGRTVYFKQEAEAPAVVTWIGASSVGARAVDGVTAAIRLMAPGPHLVRSMVRWPNGAYQENECKVLVVHYPVGAIHVERIDVVEDPLQIDPNDVNESTVAHFFGPSIAAVREMSPDYWLTSVDRAVKLRARVAPAIFASVVEWRLDGEGRRLGAAQDWSFGNPEVYKLYAGPPGHPASVVVQTYRARIANYVTGQDIIPENERVAFRAETDPPGFESYVTWMASTKYGTADPLTGEGPDFLVEFSDTFGQNPAVGSWQWLGVKADNAVFGQDQKFSVGCWDDWADGTWTDETPPNVADLDGDRDVDNDDVIIIQSRFTGEGVPYPPIDSGPPSIVFTPDSADFDNDGDIDNEDVGFLMEEFTGPIVTTDFEVTGTGVGAPLGDPSMLGYAIDRERFTLNGLLQDPDVGNRQWEFFDFGARYAFLDRQALSVPLPVSHPDVQIVMSEHGFSAAEIAVIQMRSGGLPVTDVFEGLVDLTHQTVGTVMPYIAGVPQFPVPVNANIDLALLFRTVCFQDGSGTTLVFCKKCPECTLQITNWPVCVCKGCKYTFKADGDWPGGDYAWEVVNGADKTDPDTGSGVEFETMFTGKSEAKKDITIRVTHTGSDGETCMDECTTTSVELDVTIDPPPPALATPACGGEGPATDPITEVQDGQGRFLAGAYAAKKVGIWGEVDGVKINTDPSCEDCCRSIKVGFIQNYLTLSLKATYTGNATSTARIKSECNNGNLPLLDTEDSAGTDPPWYPRIAKLRKPTIKCGIACNTAFDLSISDRPAANFPLCAANKMLTKFERDDTLRLWLVAECPKDSMNYKCLHQWDWRVEYDVDVATNANCQTAILTVNRACATNTHNGACQANDFANMKASGKQFNQCVELVDVGF